MGGKIESEGEHIPPLLMESTLSPVKNAVECLTYYKFKMGWASRI